MSSSFTLDQYYDYLDRSDFITAQPSDFYFRTDEYDGCAMTTIVAKVFFDKEQCVDDQTANIDHLLPEDFYEIMEATWECDRSVDDVRKDLIARGFEEKLKLNHGDEE